MKKSTKVAIAILAGSLLSGLMLPWSPSGSGWIWFVVVIYVCIPMLLMIVVDLSRLRQARILAKNLEVFLPTAEDPELWFDVKYAPLGMEYVARWRRWFPWAAAMLVMAMVAALVHTPWSYALAISLALIALTPEALLAVNVLRWLVPAVWQTLTIAEQIRLRICLLLMSVVMGAISAGVLGVIYLLFFVSAEPLSWRPFAFTAFYGTLVWPCGAACIRFFRRAVRRVPPEDRKSERAV
jgi:hypothetical protein